MKYDRSNHTKNICSSQTIREKIPESDQNQKPSSDNNCSHKRRNSNKTQKECSEQHCKSQNDVVELQYMNDPFLSMAASNLPMQFVSRKCNYESNSCKQIGGGRKRRSTKDLDSFRNSEQSKYTTEEEDDLSSAIQESYGKTLAPFLKSCFSKKFSFKGIWEHNRDRMNNGQRYLYSELKWKTEMLSELQNLKWKLNSVKEQLNEYDLNEWHRHTRSTNPADLVMKCLRNDIQVEFLTQAWCKFYELVSEFDLIPKKAVKAKLFYTVHLCEAPGAFVASLNHYLKLNHPEIEWHWLANSLNPYYEGNNLSQMINDDRFMLQTIDKWDFGPDMTGDITHPGYPDHLRSLLKDHLPHLVTADGSFDCQDQPEEQENKVSWLHLKETLTALKILRKGGNFVMKMFTFFECDAVCLLYLLNNVFGSIQVMKPATSKEGNSEVYVVCCGFKGEEEVEPYLNNLMYITSEEHQRYAMFPFSDINRIFSQQVYKCAFQFADIQMSIIERNIKLFPCRKNEKVRRQFRFVQEKLCEMYIEKYKLKPIKKSDNIVPMKRSCYEVRQSNRKVMENREYKQGSHADQLRRNSMVIRDIFKKISEELNSICVRKTPDRFMPNIEVNILDFKVNPGKAITTVVSSQFCYGTYIRIRNELQNVVGSDKYNIMAADLHNFNLPNIDQRFICNFRTIFYEKRNYNEAQIESFNTICLTIKNLKQGDDLVLSGFPLLTQFNVNVLCLLKQFFEQIEFIDENVLHLKRMNETRRKLWLPNITEILRKYLANRAVISFLPLKYVTGVENNIYSWIIDVNNARVLHEIELVLGFQLT